MDKIYICIDLKSFYASVECVERGLNPLTTNLVVADSERTEKTICLAVSPSLKSYGLSGRARLFEAVQKIKELNITRKKENNYKDFIRSSYDYLEINNNSRLKVDYIVATPRMSYYIKYSAKIYDIYLKYLSADDIYVYSIDEVFCDITNYLSVSKLTPREFVTRMIHDVYESTGITATAGIGTNLYLAKVAMDILAKHSKADKYGVRIAELDEKSYREKLWDYKPISSFWRVGKGISKKLEDNNMFTMGDIARCSLDNEELLYKLFGINAELLIDHAWGYEPCTIDIIKKYKPTTNSISSGQVLQNPYNYEQTKIIVKEMIYSLSLDLVEKNLVTDSLVLTIGYDASCLTNSNIYYNGFVTTDYYGRKIPKPAHGTINLEHKTSSSKVLTDAIIKLYTKIVDKELYVRRINIFANNVVDRNAIKEGRMVEQISLFTDYKKREEKIKEEKIREQEENVVQKVVLDIKNKYGKNAILKGIDFTECATARSRNEQIGGHRK